METLSFPYRPKPWVIALASAFFAALAVFMGHEAMGNDRGLIINGAIHLGPSGATVFYWCIAGIGTAFVAVGVPALFVGLLSSRRVTLTATALSVPKFGLSKASSTVRLSDVQSLSTQTVQKHRFLNVIHASGKLTINESFLPSRAAFEELCAAIASRTARAP